MGGIWNSNLGKKSLKSSSEDGTKLTFRIVYFFYRPRVEKSTGQANSFNMEPRILCTCPFWQIYKPLVLILDPDGHSTWIDICCPHSVLDTHKIQDLKIPRFQDSKIPRFQDSRFQEATHKLTCIWTSEDMCTPEPI